MSLQKEGSEERGPEGVEEWRGGRGKEGRHSCSRSAFSSNVLLFGFFHSTAASDRAAARNVNLQRINPSDVCFHQLSFITASHIKHETHTDVNPGEIFSLDQC